MNQWLKKMSPAATLGVGLALGLLFGVGMLIGAATMMSVQQPGFVLPEKALHATGTHGTDSFAIATGPIADGVEGVFMLDFLTGNLQCFVPNPRNGMLGGVYGRSVVADLGVERGKKPNYLLVTGRTSFRTVGGSTRPADSVAYVVDANTGRYAVYGMAWNRQAAAVNVTQARPMILIGKGAARNLEIRE